MTHSSPQRQRRLPPGGAGLPLIGETLEFTQDPAFVAQRQRKYGPIFKTHLFGEPTVVLSDAAGCHFALTDGAENLRPLGAWPWPTVLPLPSLITKPDALRAYHEQLIPALQGPNLANFVGLTDAITRRYLIKWDRIRNFDWFDEFKQISFDIAGEVFTGNTRVSEFADFAANYAKLEAGLLPAVPWRRNNQLSAAQARQRLLEHIEHAIKRRLRNPTTDLVSWFLAINQQTHSFDDHAIAEHLLELMLNGHAATASLLTALGLALARHPAVLERARAEQQTFGESQTVSYEQVQAMPYLDQVIKEVERCYPPFVGGFRTVVKPFEWQGHLVPAGWRVFYSSWGAHYDPQVFAEPHVFNPSRFDPQRPDASSQSQHLIGFGAGAHRCLGVEFARQEIKIIAAHLLRSYRWEILSKHVDLTPFLTLRPRNGLRVDFRRLHLGLPSA